MVNFYRILLIKETLLKRKVIIVLILILYLVQLNNDFPRNLKVPLNLLCQQFDSFFVPQTTTISINEVFSSKVLEEKDPKIDFDSSSVRL